MKGLFRFIFVFIAMGGSGLAAQNPGTGFGVQFAAGIAGSLSYFDLGIVFPKINERIFINVAARAMSAITWTTFINKDTGDSVSFHPVVIGGVIGVGGGFKSLIVDDKENMYAVASSWLGSGFGIQMGSHIYF